MIRQTFCAADGRPLLPPARCERPLRSRSRSRSPSPSRSRSPSLNPSPSPRPRRVKPAARSGTQARHGACRLPGGCPPSKSGPPQRCPRATARTTSTGASMCRCSTGRLRPSWNPWLCAPTLRTDLAGIATRRHLVAGARHPACRRGGPSPKRTRRRLRPQSSHSRKIARLFVIGSANGARTGSPDQSTGCPGPPAPAPSAVSAQGSTRCSTTQWPPNGRRRRRRSWPPARRTAALRHLSNNRHSF